MKAEKRFETKIKNYLDSKGIYYVKYFANRMTRSGIPDLISTVNGYSVWIEVKAENGRPTELQLYNRKLIRQAKGICIILYPNQFEEFKTMIEDLIHRQNGYETWYLAQYKFDRK